MSYVITKFSTAPENCHCYCAKCRTFSLGRNL